MQCSRISACSPSQRGELSPTSAGDFFVLLEAEMARNTARFKSEIDRISAGQTGLCVNDGEKLDLLEEAARLRQRVRELEQALLEANQETEALRQEREEIASLASKQLGQLELEKERMERVVERLSDENKSLNEEIRSLAQSHREEATKNKLEDKYRRALVYIDCLQSKLGTIPNPPRNRMLHRSP